MALMARPRAVSDEQVLAATVSAIGKYGPAKLTLSHVGKEAGLSPAALIQRFGSKDALLAAIGADAPAYAEAAFDAASAGSGSPVESIHEALARLTGAIRSRSEMANHLAMLQLDLANPQLHRRTAEQATAIRRRIGLLVTEAVAAGDLPQDSDPASLADVIYTAYNGALITWAIDGSGNLKDWIRKKVGAVIAPYLRPAEGDPTRR